MWRALLGIVAAAPVVFVTVDLFDTFGLAAPSVFGGLGLLALYGTVIRLARETFDAPAERLAPWARWTIIGIAISALAIPLYFGGIQ